MQMKLSITFDGTVAGLPAGQEYDAVFRLVTSVTQWVSLTGTRG